MFYKLIENSIRYLKSIKTKISGPSIAEETKKETKIFEPVILDSQSNLYFMFRSSIDASIHKDIMSRTLLIENFDLSILLDNKRYNFYLSPNYQNSGTQIDYSMHHNYLVYKNTPSRQIGDSSQNLTEEFNQTCIPIALDEKLSDSIAHTVWKKFDSLQPEKMRNGPNYRQIENHFKFRFKKELENNTAFQYTLSALLALKMKNSLDDKIGLVEHSSNNNFSNKSKI